MSRTGPFRDGTQALYWGATGLVALVATALRLYRLGAPSLGIDETVSWALSSRVGALAEGFQAPVYHVLLRPWVSILGDDAFALRFPSVVAGVATVILLIVLTSRLAGRVAGVCAGLMLACQPWHVVISRLVRPYALAIFFATAALWLLMRTVEKDRDWISATLWAMTNVLGFFTAYQFVWAIVGQVLFIVFTASPRVWLRHDVQTAFVAPLGAVALASPFLFAQYRLLVEHMRGFPVLSTLTEAPLTAWVSDLAMGAPWDAMDDGQAAWAAVLSATGLILLGASSAYGVWRRDRRMIGLLASVFGALALMVLFSIVIPMWSPFALIPFAPFLMAASVLVVRARPTWATPVVVALALGSALGSAFNADAMAADRMAWHKPESWRPMIRTLRQKLEPGDEIFISPGWMALAVRYHWRQPEDPSNAVLEIPIVEVPFDYYDPDADLSKRIGFGASTRIWVIRVAGYPSQNLTQLVDGAGFALSEHDPYWRLGLELYTRTPVAPGEIEIEAPTKEPASAGPDEDEAP